MRRQPKFKEHVVVVFNRGSQRETSWPGYRFDDGTTIVDMRTLGKDGRTLALDAGHLRTRGVPEDVIASATVSKPQGFASSTFIATSIMRSLAHDNA